MDRFLERLVSFSRLIIFDKQGNRAVGPGLLGTDVGAECR